MWLKNHRTWLMFTLRMFLVMWLKNCRTQNVLGEKGRRIRELTSVVQKRFKFSENNVELYAEKVNNKGLCAISQAIYSPSLIKRWMLTFYVVYFVRFLLHKIFRIRK